MVLVNRHKILEKCDFEFLAFVITGDPDATVLKCITTVIDLIPDLSKHLIIEHTNNNGNVQYRYIPLHPPAQSISKLTDENKFSALQSDTDSEHVSHNDDEPSDDSPPPSKRPPTSSHVIDNIYETQSLPQPSTSPGKLFQSALKNASSTLDAIHSASKDIHPTAQLQIDFDHIYDNMVQKMTTASNEHTNNLRASLSLLHDEYFNDFCLKCDEHCKNLADDFDSAMSQKLNEFESKIKMFETKIIAIQNNINNIRTSSPRPSPTRSRSSYKSKHTPQQVKPHTFGPTKQIQSSTMDNNTIPQYFHTTSLEFWHQADRYHLLDKEYLKNSPRPEPPNHVNDALSLYSQMQKNALIYNIFVTPIDDIKIWDYAPNSVPTTCNLEIDNIATFRQVYQRSAVALYTKIQTIEMKQVPIFKQLIIHEQSSQDGYKVLYAMLCGCHPRLVEKTKIDPPKFNTNGNLFTFIREYSNYIEYERVSKRNYTDIEKLSFVIEALETDGRFEKALASIKMRKNTHEEMLKFNSSSPFPPALTLDTLPYTVMQCYTPQEKSEFFNSSTTTSVATIQSINKQPYQRRNQQQMSQRRMTSTICACCGIAGHDVNRTGCDFGASFIMTNAYLRNSSSNKQFILSKFKQHQQNRLNNFNKRQSLSNRIQNREGNKRIGLSPQMKLLMDAIGEEIESEFIDEIPIDDPDNQILSVYDLLPDENTGEEFHDTSDSNLETTRD